MPKRKVSDSDSGENDYEDKSSSQEETDASESEGDSSEAESGSEKSTKKSQKTSAKTPVTKKLRSQNTEPTATSSKTKKTSVKSNAEGEKYIDLGKKKRATVRSFKGIPLLDIREFYGAEGDEKPGKKGISLTLEQWEVLREGMNTIDQLFAKQKDKK